MHRWTARFLTLVMLVPWMGPLVMAQVPSEAGMHCMRMPMADSPAVAPSTTPPQPAMHCHEMASPPAAQTEVAQPASAEGKTFRARDCCCGHDCCRNTKTSEWAQPAGRLSSFVDLSIQSATIAGSSVRISVSFFGPDSARAPPRA